MVRYIEQQETFTGADATGSSGASNRLITLTNTRLTKQGGFLVFAGGVTLSLTTEYTVSHLVGSTTVTFLNGLWDDMSVTIDYMEAISTQTGGVTNDDFANGPLNDFGVTVIRTPVTTTTDFHGDKVYTDGVSQNIEVVFVNPNKKYGLDKAGLTEDYDATIYMQSDQTIKKYDKITYDSKVYRVQTVSPKLFENNPMFQVVTLFFINDE